MGGSDYVTVCSVKETGKNSKRNAPLIHARIDPPVRNPTQSFVKELQLKSAGDKYDERAAAIHLHAECHYPRYVTARVQGVIYDMSSECSKSLGKKAYLVSSRVVPQLREVLLKDLLIESSLVHVYDL